METEFSHRKREYTKPQTARKIKPITQFEHPLMSQKVYPVDSCPELELGRYIDR